MSKWFEVIVETATCIAVEVDDDEGIEEATNYAFDEVNGGSKEINQPVIEHKTEAGIQTLINCADLVMRL